MATTGTPHLSLRPGVPVLSRDARVVQVGLDSPVVRLPDSPAVRSLLRALGRPGGLTAPGAPGEPGEPGEPGADAGAPEAVQVADALARLARAGLLVEVSRHERGTDPVLGLLRAQYGPDAVRRRAARAAALVAVHADPATRATLAELMGRAGLRVAGAGDPDADVHVVVAGGALDRAVLDPLVRACVPHVAVHGSGAARRLGPFVQPGLTACLRCVDAHESVRDVRRSLLVAQAASIAREQPPPQDPVLEALVLAWTVRDVTRYVEGDEPSTWSATVDVGPGDGPRSTRWGRHPECGCSWDEFIDLP
ncbi:hypothetical protein KG112_06990 [Nocardioides sp. zg-ZUI104]|uniref:hypothetical protein n=1 Tax=Nocardioides faecalis TaxID=2803858 RepID=UPI001BD143BA|nr:hypothetical protein [Nocardioides faecalis]MBS4752552.1 hypothetical protein [Nocardioides faecalis]